MRLQPLTRYIISPKIHYTIKRIIQMNMVILVLPSNFDGNEKIVNRTTFTLIREQSKLSSANQRNGAVI